MLGLQIKAFSLLLVLLLIVDAVGFQGQYRAAAGGKLASFASAVAPSHWGGSGSSGRDWSTPGPHR